MEILDQEGAGLPEMPRFDDGMVNLGELIRAMAESLVNEIMDAQAEEACAEGNRRNGYRERALVTSVGEIRLRIPKLRAGSYFPEDLLTRYSRTDRAVVAAVSEMVTNGVSTRKVARIAETMGIGRMSASQVSRICETLDGTVSDLCGRDLSDVSWPYVWLDATYIKCRDGGHVSSCALVTAIGAGSDGYRRLLGMGAIDTESHAGWLEFLRGLRERGVSGVACVTSDAHEGLRRAIEEASPGPPGSAASSTSSGTPPRGARPGRRGQPSSRSSTPCSPKTTRPSRGSSTNGLARRSSPSAPLRPSFWKRPSPTRLPTSTSPSSTIEGFAPTTCRSARTASLSAARGWCRRFRRGGR